jgi:hypothetical protein
MARGASGKPVTKPAGADGSDMDEVKLFSVNGSARLTTTRIPVYPLPQLKILLSTSNHSRV